MAQVAVALVGDHQAVGMGALGAGGHGGSAAVRRLDVAHVEVVIGEHRAADRADEDDAVLHPQVLDGFCDQLVGYAMPAAGTVVRLVLQVGFALVDVIKDRRFRMHDLIFRHASS